MTSESSEMGRFLMLDDDGRPLCQLKLSLILYLDYAPGPKRARRVLDLYMQRFGDRIRYYKATSDAGPYRLYDESGHRLVIQELIPSLQVANCWGLAFSDGRDVDGNLFMFHGYRPVSEPGRASFFRFEWPCATSTELIIRFVAEVASSIPFLSGSAGYIFSHKPASNFAADRMFSVCQRFWGVEAWDLDLTVRFLLSAYKCPSWLTLIGRRLIERRPDAQVDWARIESRLVFDGEYGRVLRSRPTPELIDRNRAEAYLGEREVALALLPLQLPSHDDFGGTRWSGRTMEWLYRFSQH
jgi:hypothetical protein